MVAAQKPAQSFAALHKPLGMAVRVPRKQQDVAFPLVVPLGMEMVDVVAQRAPQRVSPNKITFDRHSSLTNLTQRSA
jgi:hypothetical protein